MVSSNEVALVLGVGASKGLGAALARRFAASGYHTVISGRSQDKLDIVAREIIEMGHSCDSKTADVTIEEEVAELTQFADQAGTLKAVLYNAGNNAIIPFAELNAEMFERFWRVCCLGGFHTAQHTLPILLKNGGGSLLFTGASASLRGRANFAHFASAKAALRNLAQALAREYGPKNIHVGHVIIDGVIDGDIVRTKFGDYIDQMGEDGALDPDAIADTFVALHDQARTAWTHEIDLRPFSEKW